MFFLQLLYFCMFFREEGYDEGELDSLQDRRLSHMDMTTETQTGVYEPDIGEPEIEKFLHLIFCLFMFLFCQLLSFSRGSS